MTACKHHFCFRSNLRKLLSDTHVEMAEYGTFETLQTFMDNDIQSEKEEHQLIRDSILNDKKLKVLQAQLDGETKERKSMLKQLDDEIFDLETKSQVWKLSMFPKSCFNVELIRTPAGNHR